MSTETIPTPRADADAPDQPVLEKPTGSRTSAAMWFAVLGGVVLAFLLVFILQNLDRVPVQFLWMETDLPVGVALLGAAIAGGAIVAIAAGARILQLRRRATGWKR
ncbi:lipopolysaccharide assembly protein LapA domain-containing protein [Paraconexibacter algicola]|uniref:DUF1049 domain-containing protein n=1 Tax=Paraconexibacter algicola TaxID=2133960 RepID=A0A2T4ULP4_9ACTN|nr:lipopolysaccharide assembly protein LapA domain-containing protein [Paraconexibacter algicola]PTL60149.1 DUF1049 domain-containing protein [Paraconexibacter algicola]